ncbi:MAG: hypothetical protein RIC56_19860 [Pseudomonadales bacterium]
MTDASEDAEPGRDPRPANPDERRRHRWVHARPADRKRHEAIAATVRTPEDLGVSDYASYAPPLITLAATLGIATILGERLVDASASDPDTEPASMGIEQTVIELPDPSVLLDDDSLDDE